MITIRPFNTQDFSDYEMLSAIDKAIYPLHFDSAEALQRGTKQFKNRFLRRFLAQKDGKTIGYGTVFETFWWDEPDQYAIIGAVLPHLQGRGYGKALFEKALTAVTSQTPKSFVIWTREDKPRAIHFAKARGYKLIQRDAASILRINGFDEAAFAAA
ncbi:MAG: GNAT family N-acetyltransferase, partial [Methylococcales bacterium]|nr:GNAT family N-acetyltransferase [Methylococcales bacterium]